MSTSLAEINVVPLVDVMLVLLIIFMVAAPMMQQGLPVNLPQARRADPVNAQPVTVTVPADFKPRRMVQLGEENVRIDFLHERVRQAILARDDKSVFIRARRAAALQDLLDVTDKLKEAGVREGRADVEAGARAAATVAMHEAVSDILASGRARARAPADAGARRSSRACAAVAAVVVLMPADWRTQPAGKVEPDVHLAGRRGRPERRRHDPVVRPPCRRWRRRAEAAGRAAAGREGARDVGPDPADAEAADDRQSVNKPVDKRPSRKPTTPGRSEDRRPRADTGARPSVRRAVDRRRRHRRRADQRPTSAARSTSRR